MKKSFFPFFILFLFYIVSCSNQLQTKTSVTMNFNARSILEQDEFADSEAVNLIVKLFVNQKEFAERIIKLEPHNSDEIQPVTFEKITIGSSVYAQVWVKVTQPYGSDSFTYTVMYGQSDTVTLSMDGTELPVKLKKYEDENKYNGLGDIDISYEMYVQKIEESTGSPIDEYELQKTIKISAAYENYSNLEYLMKTSYYARIIDFEYDMEIGGYETNDELTQENVSFKDKLVTIKTYWDKTGEAQTPVVMNEQDGNNALYLYENIYYIKNEENKKLAFGNFYIVPAENNEYNFYFTQVLTYQNEEPSFIYSTDSSPDNYDTYIYSIIKDTFIVNYKKSTQSSVPMIFEIPSTFNISNFVENVGTGIPVYPVNYMRIKGLPKATISFVDSQDLTLNTGSATFKINLSNEDENPSVTTSAKLYYDGKEVDYSRFDYDFDNNTNKVTVSPNGLKKGGSYIAQIFVTSVSDGQEYTISSNFVLQVQGTFLAQVDISKTSFLNDLDQVLAGAAGNVKLVLSGTKNLNFDESPYSPGVSLLQMICNAIRQNNITAVDIDMSAVSGSIGDIFEMANYNQINCSSIKLPSSLRAIRYATGTHIDISGSDSSASNGTWYEFRLETYSAGYDEAQNIIKELFEGKRSFDSSTRSELEQNYSVYLNPETVSWNSICNLLQGNTTSYDQTIYIKGE